MELEEFKRAKLSFELAAANMLAARVEEFAKLTGVYPYEIRVTMVDVRTFGSVSEVKKEYKVGDVKFLVDLGL